MERARCPWCGQSVNGCGKRCPNCRAVVYCRDEPVVTDDVEQS